MNKPDPFADIRDKRMSELDAEQKDRAQELWLREQIGPSESYWRPHLQALFRVIDRMREQAAPIDMLLHCPNCGMQHIDEPWKPGQPLTNEQITGGEAVWTNPPHRSHLCHGCGHIWRPADVPTNGVAEIKTKGKDDSPPRKDGTPASATERRLRRMLCASRHPMAYMDDGEASDSSASPFIDYMRDSLDTIDAKMLQRFNNKHGA